MRIYISLSIEGSVSTKAIFLIGGSWGALRLTFSSGSTTEGYMSLVEGI